jgi:NADH-quinone oxidoreductase subunit G
MEMKLPHPQTREMGWAPKLFPSCQTPVKDGMEVRFDSPGVRNNQRHCMEYYLLNHPLDCPVCDKAGECYLQDYSDRFGAAASRMVEDKYKNPKKDIGPHTLLYQDRCVMCTRCVRFCDEIDGSGELTVVNRGNRAEIDVFPGVPLDNPLQGNVVDLCPVGCLLDKDFLFQQRVWLLKEAPSISPADSTGAAIWIDHNQGRVWRVRPRENEKANEWWISDEQRFSWRYVHSPDRLNRPMMRRGAALEPIRWEQIPDILRYRLERANADGAPDKATETSRDREGEVAPVTAASSAQPLPHGRGSDGNGSPSVAVVLSPMLACEEAWLLARFIRNLAPRATLVLGHVPRDGDDRTFRKGFRISAEKCPNRRGVETMIGHFGGPTASFDEFLASAAEKKFSFVYLTGGYPTAWIDKDRHKALEAVEFLVLHDLFGSTLLESAEVVIPSASWAERDGSFMNDQGLLQPFERTIPPLDGVKRDGQVFYELAGETGLYRAATVREQMSAQIEAFRELHVPRPEPKYAH